MLKTYAQQRIEAENEGKDWRQVFKESLQRHAGKNAIAVYVGADLDISSGTFYNWVKELNINLAEYRA